MSDSERVLIVDDDPEVHVLLAATLAAPHRRIESASSGVEALARIEAASYDLVIADVSIAGWDGLDLLTRIREIRNDAKVLVMTVDNTPETVIAALREQAFAFFGKPFKVSAVREMAERALASHPADDDIELLSASPRWLSLRLRCKLETGDRILQFLREMGVDLPAAEKENIAMAVREILSNAIEHGGGSDPNNRVTITYARGERALLYYVRDPGKGFSLNELAHSALSNPDDSPLEHVEVRQRLGMRPGGFGILMTRKIVDELIYSEAGNEVLLIKYLS